MPRPAGWSPGRHRDDRLAGLRGGADFWVGLLLILVFAARLGWLPANGFRAGGPVSRRRRGVATAGRALALPQAGILIRVTRAALLDVLGEDFIRTARAKGLTRRAALWRHAVPNALPPVVTILGLQFTS